MPFTNLQTDVDLARLAITHKDLDLLYIAATINYMVGIRGDTLAYNTLWADTTATVGDSIKTLYVIPPDMDLEVARAGARCTNDAVAQGAFNLYLQMPHEGNILNSTATNKAEEDALKNQLWENPPAPAMIFFLRHQIYNSGRINASGVDEENPGPFLNTKMMTSVPYYTAPPSYYEENLTHLQLCTGEIKEEYKQYLPEWQDWFRTIYSGKSGITGITHPEVLLPYRGETEHEGFTFHKENMVWRFKKNLKPGTKIHPSGLTDPTR